MMMEQSDLELFERSIGEATKRHTGEALDDALVELGWHDALAMDRTVAVSTLFPLLGATGATSSALDHVLAAGLDLEPDLSTSVVLPALASWAPPGNLLGDRLDIHGLGTSALGRRETAVVVAQRADGHSATTTVRTSDLTIRAISGIDPDFGLVEVTGDAVTFRPTEDAATDTWAGAVALAQLAVTYEILGAARAMLELARQHALDRIQFGQPISKFQAIRHRLAETLVAIEAADAVVSAAGESSELELAAFAKALAGRGSRTAARHCQQVLAGIGFTAEHPFHRYFRRVLLLDQLFGSARTLTEALGTELLATRRLPALLPL